MMGHFIMGYFIMGYFVFGSPPREGGSGRGTQIDILPTYAKKRCLMSINRI